MISTKTIFYLILLAGLLLSLAAFFVLFGQPFWQRASIILTCLFYLSWGIIYHYWEKTLHWKVVLEYLLIAFLGGAVLLSL